MSRWAVWSEGVDLEKYVEGYVDKEEEKEKEEGEAVFWMVSQSPPPGRMVPRRRGPSNRPPLKITVARLPCPPSPMGWKSSMSHSRWKRNLREGVGRV